MKITSFKEFQKLARAGFRVPILAEMANDLQTPVSLYRKFDKEPYSFLLESVEGGEKWGRYSFIGLYPSMIFSSRGRKIEIQKGRKKIVEETNDPLGRLRDMLHRYRSHPRHDHYRFSGGAVGLVGYDMVRFFETLPTRAKQTFDTPDLYFIIPEILLVIDNFEQSLKVIYDARIDDKGSIQREYQKGVRLIKKVIQKIEMPSREMKKSRKGRRALKWKESLSKKEYEKRVERVKEYVLAGDVTQTVLSVRFQAASRLDPLTLYRALRRVNPSPYMFLLKFGGMSLVGASPETMVRLEEGQLTLRPIAGTRPRGEAEEQDKLLEKGRLADAKERAEHIMLVDLGRNDLGRVAEAGSVHVDELMKIERYSHVMHIVSNVKAKLAKGNDSFDVLKATFPAGTLSGSPKIRAMEIIEELEPVRRGFYGGCVGYFDFAGNMEMAITIRSALLYQGQIIVQAGAGIVADSVPEKEYQECCNKAKAMMKAVELCS